MYLQKPNDQQGLFLLLGSSSNQPVKLPCTHTLNTLVLSLNKNKIIKFKCLCLNKIVMNINLKINSNVLITHFYS